LANYGDSPRLAPPQSSQGFSLQSNHSKKYCGASAPLFFSAAASRMTPVKPHY